MTNRPVMLLTGAAGTLGTELGRRWSAQYDIAAVWFRRPPPLPSDEQEIVDPLDPASAPDADLTPFFLPRCDLSDPDAVSGLVESVRARFGGVDVIVNAAGASLWAPLLDDGSLLADFDRQFRVNVLGPLALGIEVAKQFWRHESAADNLEHNRCVVNVSSTASFRVYPGQGQTVYAASKAALNMVTLHMAAEFAELGVRVNALAPNAFPGRVSLDVVIQGIQTLIDSDVSGRVLVLDESGWEWR